MNKASESDFMKLIGFGKGKGFAHKASQSLTQGVVPALNMCRFASLFANRVVLRRQMSEDCIVCLPKVTESRTMTVETRNPGPETPTIFFSSSPDEVGDNLAGSPTQRYPDPSFVFFEPTNDHSSSSSNTSSGCAGSSGGKSGS